jgi:hypothetical protein
LSLVEQGLLAQFSARRRIECRAHRSAMPLRECTNLYSNFPSIYFSLYSMRLLDMLCNVCPRYQFLANLQHKIQRCYDDKVAVFQVLYDDSMTHTHKRVVCAALEVRYLWLSICVCVCMHGYLCAHVCTCLSLYMCMCVSMYIVVL